MTTYIKYIGATFENWWRAKVPMQALEKLGYKTAYSTLLPLPVNPYGKPYGSGMPDIIVLNFVTDSNCPDLDSKGKRSVIETLQAYRSLYKTKIVYDFDDNIFTDTKIYNDFNKKIETVVSYLDFSDIITVTTEALKGLLADKELKYGKPKGHWTDKTYVLPNCIPDNMSCAPANKTSFSDKNRFIFPINGKYNNGETIYYRNVIKELSEISEILYIGEYSKGYAGTSGIYCIPFNLITETYLSILKGASVNRFNGLVKLMSPHTKGFSTYKSNIKLLEAGIGGLGLLIDGNASPKVYDVKNLQHIEITDFSEPLVWIPASQCRDVMEDYRIGKHIEKYRKAYGL